MLAMLKSSAWLKRNLCEACAEAIEDFLHVATFLHGNNTKVVFLIHPDQECLVVVVPVKHYEKKNHILVI